MVKEAVRQKKVAQRKMCATVGKNKARFKNINNQTMKVVAPSMRKEFNQEFNEIDPEKDNIFKLITS